MSAKWDSLANQTSYDWDFCTVPQSPRIAEVYYYNNQKWLRAWQGALSQTGGHWYAGTTSLQCWLVKRKHNLKSSNRGNVDGWHNHLGWNSPRRAKKYSTRKFNRNLIELVPCPLVILQLVNVHLIEVNYLLCFSSREDRHTPFASSGSLNRRTICSAAFFILDL